MLTIVENSDLIAAAKRGEIQHLAHGANCWSTMGAGIAGKLAEVFPVLYGADKEFHLIPEDRVGRYSEAVLAPNLRGYNLYTQFYPGPHANLNYIHDSLTFVLESIAEEMVPDQETNLGIPAIGCGIGGLQLVSVVGVINNVIHRLEEDYPGVKVNVSMYLRPGEFTKEVAHMATAGIVNVKGGV